MDNDGDLLEDMDYGDFSLLEEPSGDFSFDGTFDGDPDFSQNSTDDNNNNNNNLTAASTNLGQQQPQPLHKPQPLQPQPQLQKPAKSSNSMSGTTSSTTASMGMNASNNNTNGMNSTGPDFDLLNNSNNGNFQGRQAWHNDEKDRDARRRMIIEMYVFPKKASLCCSDGFICVFSCLNIFALLVCLFSK